MADQKFSNNNTTVLATTLLIGGVTIVVAAGTGDNFASVSGTEYQIATLLNGAEVELVKITDVAGDTITVVRAQEGTTEKDFPIGAKFYAGITKESMERVQVGLLDTSSSIAVGGAQESTILAWLASTSYSNRELIQEASFLNVRMVALNSGTSGASDPLASAPSNYDVVVDNTVNWLTISTDAGTERSAYTQVGHNSYAASNSTAIGEQSISANNAVAIGALSLAIKGVAIGYDAKAIEGPRGVVIGNNSSTTKESIVLGSEIINVIEGVNVIGGISLIRKEEADTGIVRTGNESILFSDVLDLTDPDDLAEDGDLQVSFAIPTGTVFFPSEVGLVLKDVSGLTVSGNFEIGTLSNATAILANTGFTITSNWARQKFTPLTDNGYVDTDYIIVSITTKATATTCLARFYVKGFLLEK